MSYTSYTELYGAWDHAVRTQAEASAILKRYRQRVLGLMKRRITDALKKAGPAPIMSSSTTTYTQELKFSVRGLVSYTGRELKFAIEAAVFYSSSPDCKLKAVAYCNKVFAELQKTLPLTTSHLSKDGDCFIVELDATKLDLVID